MKYINIDFGIIFLFALVLPFVWGCKQTASYNNIVSQNTSKPDTISNIAVHNFNGGAYITYTLPQSDNLLYVLAQYKINDSTSRETKVSYYTDTLEVSGFEKSKEYEVKLYAVSRAEIKSDPVIVKVHPKEPAYLLAFSSATIEPDFGGIHITVSNELEQAIGVVVISPDDNGALVPVDQVYSDDSSITFSVRGYGASPRLFGVYITDHWRNISDTFLTNITPFFEMELDKSKFREYNLPSDAKPYQYGGWPLLQLWDDNTTTGFHTELPTPLPLTFTFDLGVKAKLSRYKIWDRGGQYIGAFGNPKKWAVWGSNDPQDDAMPADVSGLSVGDVVGSWIFMGYFVSPPKPSGLPPGENTAEDEAWNAAGHEFNFSIDLPPVEYIRFQAFESYGGGSFIHIMEVSFWGQ